MAIDDLTDEAFFDLYRSNPQIKDLVDDIQKKYHVHSSQKGQPDYNESNIPTAMKEAKETVQRLLKQQKQGVESKLNPASHSTAKLDYGVGLAGAIAAIIGFGSGLYALGALGLLAAAVSMYNTAPKHSMEQKPAH